MRNLSILAGLFVVLLLAAACGSGGGAGDAPTATPLPGTLLDPPKPVAGFTLTDQRGEPFSLDDLRGQVAVLFFGYTHCPDICPTTLAEFKRVKAALGEDAAQVSFVFISVDGERDTSERLAQYMNAFDPDFVGLRGDDATIRTIARDFGVFFQRVSYDESATDYLVDHTASTFVLNQDGQLRLVFPYGTLPAIIAGRIQSELLR